MIQVKDNIVYVADYPDNLHQKALTLRMHHQFQASRREYNKATEQRYLMSN
jgi:hypothetical protein